MSNEQHVEELIVWYALGTLSPGERRAVAAHLATCAHCRGLAAEAGGTVNMLPYATEPITPSPQLKRNLLARIDADLAGTGARASTSSFWMRLRDLPTSLIRAWSPAIALASLLLVVVLGWWNWTLQNEVERTRVELNVMSSASHIAALPVVNAPSAAQARLFIPPNGTMALLVVSGLNPLGTDQTYEFWLIRGGRAVPAGLFSVKANGEGQLLVRSDEPIDNFDQAGITIEKAGGAIVPTLNTLQFAGSIKP